MATNFTPCPHCGGLNGPHVPYCQRCRRLLPGHEAIDREPRKATDEERAREHELRERLERQQERKGAREVEEARRRWREAAPENLRRLVEKGFVGFGPPRPRLVVVQDGYSVRGAMSGRGPLVSEPVGDWGSNGDLFAIRVRVMLSLLSICAVARRPLEWDPATSAMVGDHPERVIGRPWGDTMLLHRWPFPETVEELCGSAKLRDSYAEQRLPKLSEYFAPPRRVQVIAAAGRVADSYARAIFGLTQDPSAVGARNPLGGDATVEEHANGVFISIADKPSLSTNETFDRVYRALRARVTGPNLPPDWSREWQPGTSDHPFR